MMARRREIGCGCCLKVRSQFVRAAAAIVVRRWILRRSAELQVQLSRQRETRSVESLVLARPLQPIRPFERELETERLVRQFRRPELRRSSALASKGIVGVGLGCCRVCRRIDSCSVGFVRITARE